MEIKAGETAAVKSPVSGQEIGLWNRKMKYVVESGQFVVLIRKKLDGYCWKRQLLRLLREIQSGKSQGN